MTNSIMLEAKKDQLRQTQSGDWKLTLTVADMPTELLSAPMGQRLALVVVALRDNDEPTVGHIYGGNDGYVDGSAPKGKDTPRSEGAKIVQSAVMLCKDADFQDWMRTRYPGHEKYSETDDYLAAILLRHECGITTRRDLAVDPAARERFLDLREQFIRREQIR